MTIEVPSRIDQQHQAAGLGPFPNAAAFLPRFEFRVQNSAGVSNGFPLLLAQAPVVVEKEPNDTPETAQPIVVPCEVTGRLDRKSDHDWFSFTAHKGDIFVIEVWSERLGAVTDLGLAVRDAAKKGNLANLEDNAANLSPTRFPTSTTDPPPYRFVAPADGTFLVQVRGIEGRRTFGVHQFYHLRILREQPDFHLLVLPAEDGRPGANILHRGGGVRWQVFVEREGGWNGPVELEITRLPPGVLVHKQVIGAGAAQGSLVISSALDAERWAGPVQILGHGQIAGKKVARQAIAAGVVKASLNKQQGDPPLSRVERNLVLSVGETRAILDNFPFPKDRSGWLEDQFATRSDAIGRRFQGAYPDWPGRRPHWDAAGNRVQRSETDDRGAGQGNSTSHTGSQEIGCSRDVQRLPGRDRALGGVKRSDRQGSQGERQRGLPCLPNYVHRFARWCDAARGKEEVNFLHAKEMPCAILQVRTQESASCPTKSPFWLSSM